MNELDPTLSPLCAPEHVFAQFPPCYMLVGSMDVLLDDAVEFTRKLIRAKRKGTYLPFTTAPR